MAGAAKEASKPFSVFAQNGMAKTIAELSEEVRQLYLSDKIPWVVGYSGGKDSSAVLQLVWLALRELPAADRTKTVHVISTDTQVEQPLVAAWVDASHARMREAAAAQGLPFVPHKLTPAIEDSFWVNLIGKGYPAPRTKFRWCTDRLKIKPSNRFIRGLVHQYGEALLVLGTRKAESQKRAKVMAAHAADRVRARVSRNANLPNSHVYSPIEDWGNDDVWLYLMQVKNPWGHDNKSLLGMYQGASEGGECPLVVDTSTPSCGSSRFGCWVCTVVTKDRSMEAMIKNHEEKVWMTPLLELRNELDVANDRERRDFRRMGGRVQLMGDGDEIVPGPYKKEWRETWLRRVLEAQRAVRAEGPAEFAGLTLISEAEMREIRRIWLYEKHEFDDAVPRVYEEVTGEKFPETGDEGTALGADDWDLLREICGEDEVLFDVQLRLLGVERRHRGLARRAKVYQDLEKELEAGLYGTKEEALEVLGPRERLRRRLAGEDLLFGGRPGSEGGGEGEDQEHPGGGGRG